MAKKFEKEKKEYMQLVHEEMIARGFCENEIDKVIAKTGFMQAFEAFPEETLHYQVESSVDEIILVASKTT